MEVEISQAHGQIALKICEDYKILTPRAQMAFEIVALETIGLFQPLMTTLVLCKGSNSKVDNVWKIPLKH